MRLLPYLALLLAFTLAAQPANEIHNGGFEENWSGWRPFWTRHDNAGQATLDTAAPYAGRIAVKIEHTGAEDWSLNSETRLNVAPGDLFVLEGWVQARGPGNITLCVQIQDADGRVRDWLYGGESTGQTDGWQQLRSRFVVPDGITSIEPRIVGVGSGQFYIDAIDLHREGSVSQLRTDTSPSLSLTNASLIVTLDTAAATLAVTDRRTARTWQQRAVAPDVALLRAEPLPGSSSTLQADLVHLPSGAMITASYTLIGDSPAMRVTLETSEPTPLSSPVRYPYPFVTGTGSHLVVPMNEGISYPVDDPSIEPMRLIAYGGHGICMAFYGVTDGDAAHMAILETPDDAAVRITRGTDGNLTIAAEWDPSLGKLRYPRSIRYVFFERGDHVDMCQVYRAYARGQGLFKTLAEKRQRNPNVDLLIGAVNIWCWDRDGVERVRELQAAGIDRILWSRRQSPTGIRTMNSLGVLTSRYDIYQDTMNPDNFQFLGGIHPDWTTEAWPNDLMIDARGAWERGWRVRGKDGEFYPCGVLCDRQAVAYAQRRIPAELVTHPYQSRFIDTTTASPWRECYGPAHPMSRSESRHWKMELLRYISEDLNLVTGSETGHDAAVPYVHYFEGMLSLGPYRVPEAGRDIQRIWDGVPERVAKFQVGHRYRLPLWELVYHDCVVAQWYWGDYNNKLPALWDKRDLFNILYATPPMFMFNRALWESHRDRFVQSYQAIHPVVRAAGYAAMTHHRFLTSDRAVQETVFANGLRVVVNFGQSPHRLADGTELAAMGYRVWGL